MAKNPGAAFFVSVICRSLSRIPLPPTSNCVIERTKNRCGKAVGKKRKVFPSHKNVPMTLDKFTLIQVNSCKKSFLAPNLYYFNFVRTFLINKNLCFYYWLKKRIGKEWALRVVNKIEKIILVFGRERRMGDHGSL
jgi:hypothetical protein